MQPVESEPPVCSCAAAVFLDAKSGRWFRPCKENSVSHWRSASANKAIAAKSCEMLEIMCLQLQSYILQWNKNFFLAATLEFCQQPSVSMLTLVNYYLRNHDKAQLCYIFCKDNKNGASFNTLYMAKKTRLWICLYYVIIYVGKREALKIMS